MLPCHIPRLNLQSPDWRGVGEAGDGARRGIPRGGYACGFAQRKRARAGMSLNEDRRSAAHRGGSTYFRSLFAVVAAEATWPPRAGAPALVEWELTLGSPPGASEGSKGPEFVGWLGRIGVKRRISTIKEAQVPIEHWRPHYKRQAALIVGLPATGARETILPSASTFSGCSSRRRTASDAETRARGVECSSWRTLSSGEHGNGASAPFLGCYFSVIANPLRSMFAIRPTWRPVSSSTAPF